MLHNYQSLRSAQGLRRSLFGIFLAVVPKPTFDGIRDRRKEGPPLPAASTMDLPCCQKARQETPMTSSAVSGLVHVPASVGELVDKITILRIKAQRLASETKRANVARELAALEEEAAKLGGRERFEVEERELQRVNEELWDVEEHLRAHEARGDFGPTFIALARRVYITNDERARLKACINDRVGSLFREEKSYDESSR